MNRVKFITLFTIMACLLIAIPTCFAADDIGMNDTLASADADILADDCYFDVNSDTDGNGTADNPYNNFTDERIKSDSDNHLASGEYNLTSDLSRSTISFIGAGAQNTILNGNGHTLMAEQLTLTNITLKNVRILSDNILIVSALNTVFKNTNADGRGGAISSSYMATLTFTNCTFLNNSASYGGAIYISKGSIDLFNCSFENNSAVYGGAIYMGDVWLEAYNSSFNSNFASMLGGAIASVSSRSLELYNNSFSDNRAGFEGGAVYSFMGNSFIFDSSFTRNCANAGGALFIDTNTDVNITGNRFRKNSANYSAGAIYALTNVNSNMENNIYENNQAKSDKDLYETDMPFSFIADGNYLMYNYNSTYISVLPSAYSLRDEGYITPVKNQGSGSNCWSFAALAALESCILKASGQAYDLSEGNMKNLMSWFSDYGWNMEPNKGGYDKMGIGYLTAWLGPINETDDPYSPSSTISLIMNSLMHVQNIVFLTRSDYTDNDIIKRAILDYGGVATSIAWYGKYRSGKNYYCTGTADSVNHAVTIVGWDDNYSRNNFLTAAPGDGAWIIKNSWGTNSGDKGFYYVSYYDTKMAMPGKSGATFTFILNDSIKFDKNYQYDVPGKTDWFLNSTSTAWYKNVFTATDNEYLAAVSTYFDVDTKWTVSVYVNNALKLTQSGFSGESYSTINLNEMIPLKMGDIFEIVFKITVDGDAGVPISEMQSLVHPFYAENMSFISYDGENWSDLFDLEWQYPGHTYNSQVACIKAFTVFDVVNTTLKLTSELSGGFKIKAQVLNQYGRPVTGGNVTFDINGEIYSVDLVNGLAVLDLYDSAKDYNVTAFYRNVGYIQSGGNISFTTFQMDTQLNITVDTHNPVNIIAHVVNEYGQPIDCGNVTFILDGEVYVVNVTDGDATLTKVFKNIENHSVSAVFNSIYYYNSSNTQHKDFNISLIETNIDLAVDGVHNPVSFVVNVTDQYGNAVNCSNVTFKLDGDEEYTVNVTDGIATLIHIFESFGNHNVSVIFNQNYRYNASNIQIKDFNVFLINTSIELIMENDLNPVCIHANVIDEYGNPVNYGNVTVIVDGVSYNQELANGSAIFNHSFANFGLNNVSAFYNGLYIYNFSNVTAEIFVKSRTIISMIISDIYNPVNFTAYFVNEHGDFIDGGNATFLADDVNCTVKVENGMAKFNHTYVNYGLNKIYVAYSGFDYCNASYNVYDVVVKSKTKIELTVVGEHNPVNITAFVVDDHGKPVNWGNVTFILDDDEQHVVNITEGTATLMHIFKTFGHHNVSSIFNSSYYYGSLSTYEEFDVSLISTNLTLAIDDEFNPVHVHAIVCDQYGNAVDWGNVTFIFNGGEEFIANVTNGSSYFNYSFANFGLNNVSAIYTGLYFYNSSAETREIFVKSKTYINLNFSDEFNPINISAYVVDEHNETVHVGNVTFIIDDRQYIFNLSEGNVSFNHSFANFGLNNIHIIYDGVNYYNSSESYEGIFVKSKSTLNLTIDSCHNPVIINAYVIDEHGHPIDCGNVTFSVNGKQYVVNVTEGIATLTNIFKTLENNSVSAVFNSIDCYNSSNVQQKDFNVSLINTSLDLVFINDNNPIQICANVTDEYGNPVNHGNVTFIVEDKQFIIDVTNGSAKLSYSFANFGLNHVQAIYNGLYIYNSSDAACDFIVKSKTLINLTVNGEFNPVNITACVVDEHNEKVRVGNITFIIDDVPYSYELTNGTVSFSYSFANFGLNTVNVSYSAFSYYEASDIVEFVPVISKTSLNITVANEFNPIEISVSVCDEYGRALNSGNVTFIVDDVSYDVNVVKGYAYLKYSFKNLGLNNVSAVFNGLDYYLSSEISSNVNVKSTIVSADETKTLNSKYHFSLLDSYGNPLANVQITVNINSKDYNLTTDENGNAAFDITFNPGKYSITITNPLNNDTKTQTISVVKRITDNKGISMYYGAGKVYKVRVFDDNGNAAGGVKVIFKIKGKSYTRTSDSNGYVSFKISQKPGKYTITAEYKGFKVSNKVTVKTTIVTKNIKVKKGKTIKFTAKLLNKKGKIIKNKKITFKFKGKTYKVKTNKKGKATLKITKKYKAGKYTITTSYGSLKVKNTIKIKK